MRMFILIVITLSASVKFDWMKHSNALFEMDAHWILENPLFKFDDGTPFDIDQESQIDTDYSQEKTDLLHFIMLITNQPWIVIWLTVWPTGI